MSFGIICKDHRTKKETSLSFDFLVGLGEIFWGFYSGDWKGKVLIWILDFAFLINNDN